MAELEIHHEVEVHDPYGQRVGVQAAVLAVVLAVVTILSHRAHTTAVLVKAEANDTWQRYQSARVKLHSLEVLQDLTGVLPAKDHIQAKLPDYVRATAKYEQQSDELQKDAKRQEKQA